VANLRTSEGSRTFESERPQTQVEVEALLRQAEKAHGLFEHIVGGQSVWQLVRFEIATQLQGMSLVRAPVPRTRLLRSLFRAARQWLSLERAEVLCKTYDSAHRRETPQGYEDVYFDDLTGTLGTVCKMSFCDAGGYEQNLERAVHPPVLDETAFVVFSAALGRIAPFRGGALEFAALAEKINAAFGLADYSAERLRRHYSVFVWRARIFERVLRKLSPIAVLCPDNGQFALLKACRATGTPFVELQHGLFTQAHSNALPADLSEAEEHGVLLPDVLALYGGFTRDALNGTLLHRRALLEIVGAPFLDRALTSIGNSKSATAVPQITLTTQGVARDALVAFLQKFLQACDASFSLIIKLHPAYDADHQRYADAFGSDPRVTIDLGTSNNDTHALIAGSDLHLSISSACHYDALALGTPTGILKLETHASVLGLLDLGGVLLVESPADLARLVDERAWGIVPQKTSRDICERGFNPRMKQLLDGLGPSQPAQGA
jgi:hypothetical protein